MHSLNCQNATSFFWKTLGWFDDYCNTKIQLSNRQIIFNMFEYSLLLHYPIPLKTEFIYWISSKRYIIFYTCKNIIYNFVQAFLTVHWMLWQVIHVDVFLLKICFWNIHTCAYMNIHHLYFSLGFTDWQKWKKNSDIKKEGRKNKLKMWENGN